MKLITHCGTFHADDVLAYAILSSLRRHAAATLVRTRDDAVIEAAGGGDVVFDVGFRFEPDENRFDHHQKDKPLREETWNGRPIPYSSVGLVWRYFGDEYLEERISADEESRSLVWEEIDRSLILPVDMGDNGVGDAFQPTSVSALVDDFNPAWDQPSSPGESAFLAAAAFARTVLERRVAKALSRVRAYAEVAEAVRAAEDPRIIVFPASMPWERAVHDLASEEAQYVVYEKSGTWYCEAIRDEPSSFSQRKPLPEAWAGTRGQDLARITGVGDAVFCHAARFICAAGSREGVMELANLAVREPLHLPSR